MSRILLIACAAILLGTPVFAADGVMPPTPAPALDAEHDAFVHDASAHRLPNAIAVAASAVLCRGFHFDSFQKVPQPHAAASGTPAGAAPADTTALTATIAYRIQVMDDQNQAMQIRVKSTDSGQPTEAPTCEWMSWSPSVPTTADNGGHAPHAEATAH